MKNYNEESNEGYLLDDGTQYLDKVHDFDNDFSFLPERMKIENVKKLVANLHDKTKCVIHMKNLKQALNHGLVLKKVSRVIKCNKNSWLKPYVDMDIDLIKKPKNDFQKDFFKLIKNAVFRKVMENVRKHRDIRLVTTERGRNDLVSEPNYYTAKFFAEYLLAILMKKRRYL